MEPLIKSPQDIIRGIKEGQDPRVSTEEQFKIDANDQAFITKLRCGRDYWHDLPIGEYKIPVRLLTIKEKMDILAQSREWFLKLPELQRDPVLILKKQAILTLLKALTHSSYSPEDSHKYAITEESLINLDEVSFVQLFNAYNDIVQRYDVSLDNLSDAECAELHDHIKKNRQLAKELSRSQLEQAYLNLLDLATELRDSLSGLTLQKVTTMNS